VSNLPIIASRAYGTDGRTLTGAEPSAVVESLRDVDIAAIGANCCVGHATSEHVIDALRDLTSLPLVACPNAGQPELIDGTWRYPVGPDEFADLVVRLSSTAQLLGGCCGTTPDHIAAARARLKPTTLR
jgi:5-methyltetrahydrofolate--homocysteine methyltransferase